MKQQAPIFSAARDVVSGGDLRSTPFAELLVAVLDAELTGTLRIDDELGAAHALVRFEVGRPVSARVPCSDAGLMENLIPLCARAEGAYRFEPGPDGLDNAPGFVHGRIDPLALIAASMRGPVREDAVNQVLGRLGTSLLRLNPRAPLERYAFTAQETLALTKLFQGPVEALQLQDQTDVAPHLLRRLVYVLAITRGLSVLPAAQRGLSGTIAHAPPLPPLEPPRQPRSEKPTAVLPVEMFDRPLSRPPRQRVGSATILENGNRALADGTRARKSRLLASAPTAAQREAGRYQVSDPIEARTELPATALELGVPRDLPPALQLWCTEILERAGRMTRQSHYEVLGLDRDCRADQVQVAYDTLVKRYDPDQFPLELESVVERAQAILGHALHACEVLRDPARRREYDRELDAGGALGMRPAVQRGMQAEAHHRRAEALLKRKDYAGAQQEAERALSLDGSCARYEALFGWLLFLRGGATGRVDPRAQQHLTTALKRDPRCEQAHYYMAVVLKQNGNPDRSIEHFKRVLKLNPNHLEAAREVRLFEMRNRPPGAGLLDKLLGRGPSSAPPRARGSDRPGASKSSKPRARPSWKPTR